MEYNKTYLPWIEKYRPRKINNIIGQKENIYSLKKMLKGGSFPHMLFHGKSGTGKTSTILALARELYGKKTTMMIMKLDASDDRGINSVREEIKGFAEKISLYNKGIKLIILDEADSMTFDAQFALRRIIEKYSDTTRFCLICNYENKIIPAIKSRCANFRFVPISTECIYNKLKRIAAKEKLIIEDDSLNAVALLSYGDLRKSINLLQSISMRSKKINIDLCYETAGVPPMGVVKKIYKTLIDKSIDFNKTYKLVNKKIVMKGYSLSILLRELTKYMIEHMNTINKNKLPIYFSELCDLESQVSRSTFGDIYITSLIGIFKK